MGQYKFDPYNKSNFIQYTITGLDLIESIPYMKCLIPNSVKTEIPQVYDFFIVGIFAI